MRKKTKPFDVILIFILLASAAKFSLLFDFILFTDNEDAGADDDESSRGFLLDSSLIEMLSPLLLVDLLILALPLVFAVTWLCSKGLLIAPPPFVTLAGLLVVSLVFSLLSS